MEDTGATNEITSLTNQMRDFTERFVTPITYENRDGVPTLSGTGTFVEVLGRRLLLTCEHVVLGRQELAFRPFGTENFLRAPARFASISDPYDIAVARIGDDLWQAAEHQAMAVGPDSFDLTHAAVEDELLFFRGYAGENSVFGFDTMVTRSSSYTTQKKREGVESIDDRYHFVLLHNPEEVQFIDKKVHFEDPSGFSGSLVWDTGYVNCLKTGASWSPEVARVTGIVSHWAVGDPGISVLRVEHLRSYLLSAIEDMRVNSDW
jgi:hypothetical protein